MAENRTRIRLIQRILADNVLVTERANKNFTAEYAKNAEKTL